MSKNPAPSSRSKTDGRSNILLFAALAAVLGVAAYATLSGIPRSGHGSATSGKTDPVPSRLTIGVAMLADPRIGEVAGEFNCPCGGCGVMELRECECDMPRGALEAKGKIAALLQQGIAPAEVVERIAARYGARKAPQPAADEPRALEDAGAGAK